MRRREKKYYCERGKKVMEQSTASIATIASLAFNLTNSLVHVGRGTPPTNNTTYLLGFFFNLKNIFLPTKYEFL